MQPHASSASQPQPHILVVDDDDRLRALLQRYLSKQGFVVNTAASADEASKAMATFHFQAIVLDIMMPGKDGLTFARELEGSQLPILILSAKGEPEDRITGLEAGVDDYLTKPFEPEELVLRIKSLLRRAQRQREVAAPITFGNRVFDPTSRRLTEGEVVIDLTSTEEELLVVLAAQRGRAISRDELAQKCRLNSERNVDIHITRLRKKIEADPARPLFLKTIRNIGYGLFSD